MVFPVTSHNSIRTNSGEHLVDRSSRIGRSFLLRMKDGAFARGFRLRSYSSPRRRSVPAQLSPLLIFPQSQLSVAALMRMLLTCVRIALQHWDQRPTSPRMGDSIRTSSQVTSFLWDSLIPLRFTFSNTVH